MTALTGLEPDADGEALTGARHQRDGGYRLHE